MEPLGVRLARSRVSVSPRFPTDDSVTVLWRGVYLKSFSQLVGEYHDCVTVLPCRGRYLPFTEFGEEVHNSPDCLVRRAPDLLERG